MAPAFYAAAKAPRLQDSISETMDKAKKEVERLSREAAEDLDKLGSNEFLEGLIRFLVNREK